MGWKVGIDTGGTFTDVAAVDMESGRLAIAKVPSIPSDPEAAVINGLNQLFVEVGHSGPRDIEFLGHGTTIATNALLEMKGARVGLLQTRGYRGVYEVRGGTRPTGSDLIDTFYQKPPPLVSQEFSEQIDERIASDGTVLTPLNEDSVREAIRHLRERGVNSIAVCYLFSFMNSRHEERTAEIIREQYPDCRVSLSSSVLPVIREYRRVSTTSLDAYVGPIVEGYLRRLSKSLRRSAVNTEQLYVMQSNGGLMRIDVGANYPNQTLLSGPAAGVVFGAAIAELVKERNVVTFDMGGTSADVGTIVDGEYAETREGQIGGQDIGTSMIEIRTFGAGGGTIAWIGPDGLLKVGPQSAGANPGPVCYGRGGTEATVTDANLVLGYLGPDSFLGGSMHIDPERARDAISAQVAEPFSLSVEDAALGIVRIVNVKMEGGIRLALTERGLDPRKFVLMAFGGCGPIHAARLARNVRIPRVIVPPYPGIGCAMGLLQTDVRHHYVQSRFAPLLTYPVEELNSVIQTLESKARADAELEGFDPKEIEIDCQLDLRYPNQGYELAVPTPARITEGDRGRLRRAFDKLHQQVFGANAPDEEPEIVNVRLTSVARIPKLRLDEQPLVGSSPSAPHVGERPVYFEETGKYLSTPIYRRSELAAGNRIDGPAIVEQLDATTVVYPRQRARVDGFGNLIIEVEFAGEGQ